MPSTNQDRAFAEAMSQQIDEVKISATALDEAIDWITGNLSPDDVFSEKALSDWAENNGYKKE